MSNLLTTVIALNASSNAAEAANEARKAKNAAESVVDAQAKFIIIPEASFETVKTDGFFTPNKSKLKGEYKRMSIKNTDVASIREDEDDFGNKYAVLVMESRYFDENDNDSEINTNLSLRDATAIVNLEAKLP